MRDLWSVDARVGFLLYIQPSFGLKLPTSRAGIIIRPIKS